MSGFEEQAGGEAQLTLAKVPIEVPDIGIYIHHRNDEGDITAHDLTIKRIWSVSLRNTLIVLSLDGFCHIHNEERSFDFSGIAGAWEREGGNGIWDPVSWIFIKLGETSSGRTPGG